VDYCRLMHLFDKILELDSFREQTDFLKKSGWKLQVIERNGKVEIAKSFLKTNHKKIAWLSIDVTEDHDFIIQDIKLVDNSYQKQVMF
jgi:hypothetical protein